MVTSYTPYRAMYNGFQCAVEVNNKCTPYFSVNCGVKQGCPLSPSLFSLFINDLLVDLNASGLGVDCGGYTNIPVLGYADDTALFAGNPRDLQLLLNKVQTWCTSNGIKQKSCTLEPRGGHSQSLILSLMVIP